MAEPPKLPLSESKIIEDVRWQCYDFDNFKLLLKFEAEHQACVWDRQLREDRSAEVEEQIDALRNVVTLQKASLRDVEADRARMYELWKKENKKRHEAENKPSFTSWLGWGVAGVATAALGGFILKGQLD